MSKNLSTWFMNDSKEKMLFAVDIDGEIKALAFLLQLLRTLLSCHCCLVPVKSKAAYCGGL